MNTIKKQELLPSHYVEAKEPSFHGVGDHNVIELEAIAEGYKELVHQLRLREQSILRKFSIEIIVDSNICTDTGEECRHNCSGLCKERC